MPRLELVELDDEQFQGALESCGDMEPYGLLLDGEVIGLANVRYSKDSLGKLKDLGIELVSE